MKHSAGQRRRSRGVTLIEAIIASVVVVIAVIGGLSYGYHSGMQLRRARAYSGAVRVAYYLLEDWKASGGSELYAMGAPMVHNPSNLNIGTIRDEGGGDRNNYFENMGEGVYRITIDNVPMRITLTRPVGYRQIMPLTATVKWDTGSVALNTNARVGQAGG